MLILVLVLGPGRWLVLRCAGDLPEKNLSPYTPPPTAHPVAGLGGSVPFRPERAQAPVGVGAGCGAEKLQGTVAAGALEGRVGGSLHYLEGRVPEA